ncbi:MAG: endonuclease MutS2 [Anaerofustis stercorihominis]|nr:endonuclease MutS2 [Anaerofustis stercorihominis]
MEEKQLRNIEFDKIRHILADKAFTKEAKDEILCLMPFESEYLLKEELLILKEAVDLSFLSGRLPIYGYIGISDSVNHAKKGGTIRNESLLRIASSLRTASQLRRYLFTPDNPNVSFVRLEGEAEELRDLAALEKEIKRIVINETDIADDASPQLYSIRREIRIANSQIKDKLNNIISSAEKKKYLQDSLITIRSGRYVVPVKSENKAMISGIVHDSSSSGLTLYIEPEAVVRLNNKLRELEIEESREIDRILKELSEKVAANADYILHNEKIIIRMDFLFAKAEYAIAENHSMPVFTDEHRIMLRKAFHPLIDRSVVVASDISIGEGYNQMVITGPNTGGKTVTLKTLGLCSVMAQSGMFIPANEGSEVCMLDNIFSDIGDEQSIAQSLSTFSSHMKNIVYIMENMTENSLILLDEVGAGTDPSEGAALAWAILRNIRDSGALSLATTHYSEIKQYALTESGVINASMEFDIERLAPTYRLNIGIPGKSNAFEISKRLGLDETVLEEANSLLSRRDMQMEDIISKLEAKLLQASESARKAQDNLLQSTIMREELEAEQRKIRKAKENLMTQSALEAKAIIKQAQERANEIISEADRYLQSNPSQRNQARTKIRQMGKASLNDINEYIPTHDLLTDYAANTSSDVKFKKGDEAFLQDVNADCVILDIDEESAFVQVGMIKTKVPVSKLSPKTATKKKEKGGFVNTKASKISTTLDIRGITGAEVPIEVEKYLDDAMLAGLKIVTILHGKGNGVLKKQVAKCLNAHPLVEEFRPGGLKEGGDGVTVVKLG